MAHSDHGSVVPGEDDLRTSPDDVPTEDEAVKDNVDQLAQHETDRIRSWRVLVLDLILVVGAVVSVSSFIFLHRNEEDEYRERVSILYHLLSLPVDRH